MNILSKFNQAYNNAGEVQKKINNYNSLVENNYSSSPFDSMRLNTKIAYAFYDLAFLYEKRRRYDLALKNYSMALDYDDNLCCARDRLNIIKKKSIRPTRRYTYNTDIA